MSSLVTIAVLLIVFIGMFSYLRLALIDNPGLEYFDEKKFRVSTEAGNESDTLSESDLLAINPSRPTGRFGFIEQTVSQFWRMITFSDANMPALLRLLIGGMVITVGSLLVVGLLRGVY